MATGVSSAIWQPALFGATESASRRRALDPTSWVEVVPGWLPDADALFAHLLESVAWQQRERRMYEKLLPEPRLTAEIGDLARAPHPSLRDAAEALSTQYGVRYDHLWLNLYRDGRDSTAWHGDRISCRREECVVPVLTLGATRRFLLKPRRGGTSLVFKPAAGDLVVMGGRCQRDWVHSVPKAADVVGARISINFQSSEQARLG
ncbi:MAG TPA: alpha-ketoglutarate-dependent dioxygenase AlkB [Myxococcota bacterium]|nr:alpha-ketoglutarate-dependent dioxygenase AlkB [Myxococcota bacterium]